jgi:hypothetical protein
MFTGIRVPRLIAVAASVTLLLAMAIPTCAEASGTTTTTTFSPIAHKAALLKVLDADVAKGEKINRLTIKPSPINPAWVYYIAGIPVRASNGTTQEDMAEGFAHWVNGKWVIAYGPWSVSCGPLKSLSKIPKAVRNSFTKICK